MIKSLFTRTALPGKLFLFVCLVIMSNQATAIIRYVKPVASGTGTGASWANASSDLQGMINASTTVDQVWVAGGTYQPPSGGSFSMKLNVKIYGGFAGTETALNQRNLTLTANTSTLKGNGASVVYNNFNSFSPGGVLDGFTITGATGSGIYNTNKSSPTISNCTITGNTATTDNGGGICNNALSSPNITNCVISGNTAPTGGGIANSVSSNAVITNCTFSANTATTGGGMYNEGSAPRYTDCTISGNTANEGGGMSNLGGSPTFTNCSITGNTAQAGNGGGGLNAGGSLPVLTDCIISNNTASNNGGGVSNELNSSAAFTRCQFTGNTASSGGGMANNNTAFKLINCFLGGNNAVSGGGIYNINIPGSGRRGDLIGCLFSGNTASNGGAVYNAASVVVLTFTSCTFSGNSALNDGGGIYNQGSAFVMRNTILYGNSSGIFNVSTTPVISYSLVQGLTATTSGNIAGTTDPLFISPLAAGLSTGGDYRLQPCSPVVDKGTNTVYATGKTPDLSAITTDLAANTRFYNGGTGDMGAYEFAGSYGGNPNGTDWLAINGDAAAVTIAGSTTLTAALSACRTVAALSPDGSATSISGTVNASVWVESVQPSDHVKRHYEITPLVNAGTATGRVTLYFTQPEFDDFNAINGLKLPTGPADITGIANLRVEKRSGVSSDGSGMLNTYNGARITIDPSDAAIVWNSVASRWEVSFDVAGFSGFFVKTQTAILPLRLLSFSGSRKSGYNQVQWTTAAEINTHHFELERSMDGALFTNIATINAVGNGNGAYSYQDAVAYNGKLLYRLKMVDVNGVFTYSKVIVLSNDGKRNISLYPNPASDVVHVSVGNELLHSNVKLYDANGRLLQTIVITNGLQSVSVQQLGSGVYSLKFADGSVEKFVKR